MWISYSSLIALITTTIIIIQNITKIIQAIKMLHPKKNYKPTSIADEADDEISENENIIPVEASDEPINDVDKDGPTSEEEEEVELLTAEDIRIFLQNDSVIAAQSCSQEAQSHHVPTMNMIFDTDDEAYKFYNDYSLICGFSIMRSTMYNSRKSVEKLTTTRTFQCNRGGKPVDEEELERRKKQKQLKKQQRTGKPPPKTTRKRKRNPIQHTGCLAKMVITLKDDKWVVTGIDLQHNHELSPEDEKKFLRSHKQMTPDEKLFIRTFTSVKMPTRKIMDVLTYLRGGKPKDVPYDKKYVSNVRTAIRNEKKENDMTQVLAYFRKRQSEDPNFYYNFKLGDGNKVECIFWSDSYSRRMYELYGDCTSFDTTYKTNRYNLPFAPFVGVTDHGSSGKKAPSMKTTEKKKTQQNAQKE
ncbi:hypothetical protein ACQ4PT_046695 [Festuca glaucescens]